MPSLIDLTGQKFNRLLVLQRGKNIGRQTAWICKCDCGNKVLVRGADLKNGHTKSCGCFKNEKTAQRNKDNRENIVGNKYGLLTVVEETKLRNRDNKVLYKCKCSCGSTLDVYATSYELKSNHKISCGCLISKGEYKIRQLLSKNNINFETQKTFDSCRYPMTNSLLKFDFYIDNKYLIEFDGKQHFIAYESGWSTESNLIETQKRDKFKNEWCKKNNIILIRIPYLDLDKIDINDLLETSKYKI